MKLVIVESPTKARTISQYLSSDEYRVESSVGHVRDLPKSKLGIDVEKNFDPTYVIPTKARKRVNELKKIAHLADTVILATDEDREGEAIAWHLVEALELATTKARIERIVFHEITKRAIEEALAKPRAIDDNRVDAQQARRVLDRLVGYQLSPFLWQKIFRGLSAGRVQSVALRLVVEREREIRAFKPQEYWSIAALFTKDGKEFRAELKERDGKKVDKFDITTGDDAKRIAGAVSAKPFTITGVETKIRRRKAPPPFTTSTLQQAGSARLRLSARQTMRIAQMLYEEGLITYMRTDSLNLSEESLAAAQRVITAEYGERYTEGAPRRYKTKSKGAQEAHEAIRPTDPAKTPGGLKDSLDEQKYKMYNMIWRRFIGSQMPDAEFQTVGAALETTGTDGIRYGFGASGITLQFDGFTAAWKIQSEEIELPPLEQSADLTPGKMLPEQHFTQPPPRYSEATLVKTLEEFGIGRPSTYAPIISVIQDRNYVEKNDQRKFQPTEIGFTVNDLLVEHFPEVVDIGFTAKMEASLDEVAEGRTHWQPVIKEFYEPFSKHLAQKYEEVSKIEAPEEKTDEVCDKESTWYRVTFDDGRSGWIADHQLAPEVAPKKTKETEEQKAAAPKRGRGKPKAPPPTPKTVGERVKTAAKTNIYEKAGGHGTVVGEIGKGSPGVVVEKAENVLCGKPMMVKAGRFGKFLACSGFPDCKKTKSLASELKTVGMKCPTCLEGDVIERRTRNKRVFYGCSRWPKCDYASWKNPAAEVNQAKEEEAASGPEDLTDTDV